MTKLGQMIKEIKVDLGSDINSLGISDESIELKINEALRKVAAYAPKVVTETLPGASVIELPEGTSTVIDIMSDQMSQTGQAITKDQVNVFASGMYMMNRSPNIDPYLGLMFKSEMNTLQSFYQLKDWYFVEETCKLYINKPPAQVTVKYLLPYKDLEEVTDPDILQTIKEYALALCKIIEGNIRRKLQSAPGAIQMDGASLVSEGQSEKAKLDDWIPRQYANIRFGLRA